MSGLPASFPAGFEWDEAKNLANVRKHGIDFRDAVRIFEKPTLDIVDNRQDYGEVRVNSVGELSGTPIVMVTHTDREEHTRLISARPATRPERAAYLEFERELAGERSGQRSRDRGRDF